MKTFLSLATAALALAFAATAHGQSQTWNGGDGTWDAGITADWSGGTWTNGNQAVFYSTPGAINVASGVTNSQMYFSSGAGNWVFSGADITDVQGGNFAVYADGNNASNITINNNIILSYNPSNNEQGVQNYGTGIMTLNGNISLSGAPVGGSYQQYYFDAGAVGANGAGSLVINGSVSTTNVGAEADFGFRGGSAQAEYVFGPNANFSGMSSVNVASATVLLQTNNIEQQITMEDGNSNVLTSGAVNYSGALYERVTSTVATIGGATADASSFTGSLHIDDDAQLAATAATGGRVTLDNNINGTLGGNGLVKTGDGTVVIAGSSGGSSGTGMGYGISGTVAADLQSGTTLITNNSGSAFGNNSGIVNLDAGATLGGNGKASQNVVVADSTSVLAPGDAGQSNLNIQSSIGMLSLGNVTAVNGLTMDFKLTGEGFNGFSNIATAGTSSDLLFIGALDLGGTVNINLTAMDALQTGEIYYLVEGGGTWTGENGLTFDVSTPAGYALDQSYGSDGIFFDTSDDAISIQLVAAPEPSTYALLGLGLVGLIVIRRFRSLRA